MPLNGHVMATFAFFILVIEVITNSFPLHGVIDMSVKLTFSALKSSVKSVYIIVLSNKNYNLT